MINTRTGQSSSLSLWYRSFTQSVRGDAGYVDEQTNAIRTCTWQLLRISAPDEHERWWRKETGSTATKQTVGIVFIETCLCVRSSCNVHFWEIPLEPQHCAGLTLQNSLMGSTNAAFVAVSRSSNFEIKKRKRISFRYKAIKSMYIRVRTSTCACTMVQYYM